MNYLSSNLIVFCGPTGFDKVNYFIVFKRFYLVQLSDMPPYDFFDLSIDGIFFLGKENTSNNKNT